MPFDPPHIDDCRDIDAEIKESICLRCKGLGRVLDVEAPELSEGEMPCPACEGSGYSKDREMTWQLHEVEEIECTLDDCGYYVTINRIEERREFKDRAATFVKVRADLITADNEPVVSFVGSANAVRKHLMKYLTDRMVSLGYPSPEHASYIGYELLRAETTPHYVQN